MSKNFKAELVGAFGDPIAENPTGVMQEAGFRAAGLDWRYLTLQVKAEDLPAAVAGARAFGMRGFNLTIPHKVAVIEHLDGLSKEAETIGAVNTVCIENGRLTGENTDGKGFLRGVRQDAGVDPSRKTRSGPRSRRGSARGGGGTVTRGRSRHSSGQPLRRARRIK